MGVQPCIALTTDHLVTVVLLGKLMKGRLDDATTQARHQGQGRVLLDVVVQKSVAVLQLFAGKYQTLLVRCDAFLVLYHGFDILDSVTGLVLKSLTHQGLHKDLQAGVHTAASLKRKSCLLILDLPILASQIQGL